MLKTDIPSRLLPLLRQPKIRLTVLKLLYQIVIAVPEDSSGTRFREATDAVVSLLPAVTDDGDEDAVLAVLAHLYPLHATPLQRLGHMTRKSVFGLVVVVVGIEGAVVEIAHCRGPLARVGA